MCQQEAIVLLYDRRKKKMTFYQSSKEFTLEEAIFAKKVMK